MRFRGINQTSIVQHSQPAASQENYQTTEAHWSTFYYTSRKQLARLDDEVEKYPIYSAVNIGRICMGAVTMDLGGFEFFSTLGLTMPRCI